MVRRMGIFGWEGGSWGRTPISEVNDHLKINAMLCPDKSIIDSASPTSFFRLIRTKVTISMHSDWWCALVSRNLLLGR